MKIKKFEVSNFRSITKAIKIEFKDYNVLVGANNMGKSNVLNAIILALDLVKSSSYMKLTKGKTTGLIRIDRNQYDKQRDFPIGLKKADMKHTTFKITFILSQEERAEIKKKEGININKDITLKFEFIEQNVTYNVLMPGIANEKFNKNKHIIAKFIADNITPIYIPCIRDVNMSEEAFQDAWYDELEMLKEDEEYKKCLEIIKIKEAEALEVLQGNILNTVSTYITGVKDIKYIENTRRRKLISNGRIYIDDGVNTELALKGDGIKSLTAMALLSRNAEKSVSSFFCIEEPEAHLHPSAIYGIKKILLNMSKNTQVLIATHSSIMVDKYDVSNNIIVSQNEVNKCKNINDIRNCLGVQIADDLTGSEVILLVEGYSDVIIIKKLLSEYFDIDSYINNKRLKIINMRGGTKASNLVIFYNSLLMQTHLLIDNDQCGKNERTKLLSLGLLDHKDITQVSFSDMKSSEMEDAILIDMYNQYIIDKYSVDVKNDILFKDKNKEWSCRIKSIFINQGQPIDDDIEKDIKTHIAGVVELEGKKALYKHRDKWVDALANSIKNKLGIR